MKTLSNELAAAKQEAERVEEKRRKDVAQLQEEMRKVHCDAKDEVKLLQKENAHRLAEAKEEVEAAMCGLEAAKEKFEQDLRRELEEAEIKYEKKLKEEREHSAHEQKKCKAEMRQLSESAAAERTRSRKKMREANARFKSAKVAHKKEIMNTKRVSAEEAIRKHVVSLQARFLAHNYPKACFSCAIPFGALSASRHHCRACGLLVCDECSLNRVPSLLVGSGSTQEEFRVCNLCYTSACPQWIPSDVVGDVASI